jgi:hypothetical protein
MARRKAKKWHGARALLNRVGYSSTGAIVCEIEDTSGWEDGKDGDGDEIDPRWPSTPRYTFQVANCDRSISFELDFGDADERANNLYKLDTMIDVLTKFRAGVLLENERYEQRHRRAERADR